MHTSEDFTMDQIQKHLRIEEETHIREKNLNGASTSKVNYVDLGKNNKGNDKKRKGAKNVVSTTKCLELLHMDLFGPSAVRSYGGNRYTLVIVDDYSREFCNANGITHNFSDPRTPQSNGMVERKNMTLQEMSRTKLKEQSLPQKFWCNAVDTSTYILNRILIRAILGKIPYELLREPKNVNEALTDESWIIAMQEELNQFVANDVLELVPQPMNMTTMATKWVFRNKLDENGVVSRNKA
ncbi:retrovirus-related pol polyprotein from transposon TNT 1-94, partial [Tanacetum coccineum]